MQTTTNLTLTHVLAPEQTLCYSGEPLNKKNLFELLAKQAAERAPKVKYQQFLQDLNTREQLGTTYIGHGIAIPHARVKGLEKPIAVLVKTEEPVQYDDEGEHLLKIALALFVPENAKEAHLELLASIAKNLSDSDYRQHLFDATSADALYNIATHAK